MATTPPINALFESLRQGSRQLPDMKSHDQDETLGMATSAMGKLMNPLSYAPAGLLSSNTAISKQDRDNKYRFQLLMLRDHAIHSKALHMIVLHVSHADVLPKTLEPFTFIHMLIIEDRTKDYNRRNKYLEHHLAADPTPLNTPHRTRNRTMSLHYTYRDKADMTFQVTIQFMLITARSSRRCGGQAHYLLERLFSAPYVGPCSIPGCQAQHTYRPRFSRDAGDPKAWTVTPRPGPWKPDVGFAMLGIDGSKYRVYFPELQSPKFSTERPAWWMKAKRDGRETIPDHRDYYTPEWVIAFVLKRIRSINARPGLYGLFAVFMNDQCNYFVTIESQPGDNRLPLRAYQNIVKTMLLQERNLDSIRTHSTIRVGTLDVLQIINAIDKIRTYRDLRDLSATHLPSLAAEILPSSSTRFHAIKFTFPGTLDDDEINTHIHLTISLINWCHNTSSQDLNLFLRSKWPDMTYTFLDFLIDIQVHRRVHRYFANRFGYTQRGESWALRIYQRTMSQVSQYSPLWSVVDHWGKMKAMGADWSTTSIVILEKMVGGEYGWFAADVPAEEVEGGWVTWNGGFARFAGGIPVGEWEGGVPMFGAMVTRVGWQESGEGWEIFGEENGDVVEGCEDGEKRVDSVVGLKALDVGQEELPEYSCVMVLRTVAISCHECILIVTTATSLLLIVSD
ncbi:uncharacterized protein MYCFIDRAFT_176897 [Pseudocercospora fijiensis CIRAD86]|uniref:Uncharacterized protein n=1 Tax=Pseudocercospora fijiensis (strain CIRAD86) TaxID=383855 RepID=M3A5K8_PSEFD|nr:uncharacterized protein MYCFIDRAFT_176897 [Pseudocercospora fijiensis CIRAD86]EME79896.1 hypothetical protein MYCFIDRAFT_176897 [Pseudocercospora fijiensis CIRAD86]